MAAHSQPAAPNIVSALLYWRRTSDGYVDLNDGFLAADSGERGRA
jgi:hypothetical protein